MVVPFPTVLREIREARGLSLSRLARQSSVSKSALSKWEAARAQPCLPELNATLDALEATPEERRRILEAMSAPRAVQRLREEAGSDPDYGQIPSGGDLLRAMRHRHHLSLEQVATQIGVRASTLSRWENSQAVPSSERLEELFGVLDPFPHEREAISRGVLQALQIVESPPSLDEIEAYLRDFQAPDALVDLYFLTLEAHLWPLAKESRPARDLLARAFRDHAIRLNTIGRWEEAVLYSERALMIWQREFAPTFLWAWPVHVLSTASMKGERKNPKRGIEILSRWQDLPLHRHPDHQAMLDRNMADFFVYMGREKEAMSLYDRADSLATRCENPLEARLARLDRVEALHQLGHSESALRLMPDPNDMEDLSDFRRVIESLLRTEILMNLDDHHGAHEELQYALTTIETGRDVSMDLRLLSLKPKAVALVERFDRGNIVRQGER